MLFQNLYRAGLWASIIGVLAACTHAPPEAAPPTVQTPPKAPATTPPATPQTNGGTRASNAANPHDYRRDGAAHLYAKNVDRIYPGKLPPMLYAIGVLQVDINASGAVTALRWMRAPTQAPEVVAEIERAVRHAAPFPAPIRMGRVTYTDTWLWDKSGRFQLDTLTEGQL